MTRFFASGVLSRYLARTFLVRTFAVLAMLVVVLQTLDLLGESGDILAHPGNGDAAIVHYVFLRLPQIVAQFLPFSVLLGALITLAQMNGNSEIISMKAAGVSAHQILAPLIAASVGVAGLSFVFNERIVARSTATLSAWTAADYGPLPRSRNSASNIWVRDGEDLIHAATATGRGPATVLHHVQVFDRTGNILTSIVEGGDARQLSSSGAGWTLKAPRVFDVARGAATRPATYLFGRGITADRFTLAEVHADGLDIAALSDAIGQLDAGGRPTGPLRAGWWHKLSGPLSSVMMPLLAAVAGFGLARSGRLFIRAVIGMALGFSYFVADNAALAMGNLGAYPPLLAAWSPVLLFLLIGETVLIRTEE